MNHYDLQHSSIENQETKIFCGIIPTQILLNKNLTQTEKILYGIFSGFYFNDRACTASNATLGEVLGVSGSVISHSVSKLKSLGLVHVTIDKRGFRTITCLNLNSNNQISDLKIDQSVSVPLAENSYPPSQNQLPPLLKTATPLAENSYQRKNIKKKIKKEDNLSLGEGDAKAPLSKQIVISNSNTSLVKEESKPKITIFNSKHSIPLEHYLQILADSTLANNDRQYLKEQVRSMADWSASSLKKKANWTATLRNWIRRSRQNNINPIGVEIKSKIKTFKELETDWDKKQTEEFLRRTNNG